MIQQDRSSKGLSAALEERAGKRTVFIPVAACLLAYLFIVSILEMRIQSVSSDEVVHLPAGITYLRTGDFRLNPQHPPLVKILSAIPVLFLNPKMDLNDPAWQKESLNQWVFGANLLFANDAERLLFWGRMPILLLSLALGLFIFIWAKELYGNMASLLALFLYALSPDVIAHSHFITMDVPLSAFILLTLYFLWKWTKAGKLLDFIMTGLFLGCALATKFSAIVLLMALPVIFLILAVKGKSDNGKKIPERRMRDVHLFLQPLGFETRKRRLFASAISCLVLIVIAFIVVQGFYFYSSDITIYFKGMKQVNIDHNPDFQYYLLGDFKKGGWWYYFPLAFLMKTPIPALLFLFVSLFSLVSFRSRFLANEMFLLLPSLGLLIMTMAYADNVGVRYLLPVMPLLFIFSSRVVHFMVQERIKFGMIAAAAAWYLASSVAIYPEHLCYFNEFIGGPANGYKYLDDSNLEWGQDFKRMADYIKKKGVKDSYFLAWLGGEAGYYGLDARNIDDIGVDALMGKPPEPGTYFMSIHLLLRLRLYAKQTGNSYFDWLHLYDPVDRIGHSTLIYRFTSSVPRSR